MIKRHASKFLLDVQVTIRKNNMNDELTEVMDDYDLERDEAGQVLDIADELGVDFDDAHEIWESM